MPDTYNNPVEIKRNEDDRFVVAFSDFAWGATDGASQEETLTEAKDLLRELIATMIRDGEPLPVPSRSGKERPLVVTSIQIAQKDALNEAWRENGISQRRFARDLVVAESKVRRMLNPVHNTNAATVDHALRRLGKRVTVTLVQRPDRNSGGAKVFRSIGLPFKIDPTEQFTEFVSLGIPSAVGFRSNKLHSLI